MSDDDEGSQPAPYRHCVKIYNAMLAVAESRTTEAGEEILVYRGYLTAVFKEQGLPAPYYTTVLNNLKRMGCVKQLARGGGPAMSEWQVMHAPTPELMETAIAVSTPPSSRVAGLEQQNRDLNKRIRDLEEVVAMLGEAS